MVHPLDRVKSAHAEMTGQAARERGDKSQEAIAQFYDACDRYFTQVTESDIYSRVDIITFDSSIGRSEYAGKVFGGGGNFASPAGIAMIFMEDGSYILLNDGGAGGILDLPAGGRFPYPVRVLPVDRGEEEIFGSRLPSGRRRSKWGAYDETVFMANNTPDAIEKAAGRIESEISILKSLAAARLEEQEASNNQ